MAGRARRPHQPLILPKTRTRKQTLLQERSRDWPEEMPHPIAPPRLPASGASSAEGRSQVLSQMGSSHSAPSSWLLVKAGLLQTPQEQQ